MASKPDYLEPPVTVSPGHQQLRLTSTCIQHQQQPPLPLPRSHHFPLPPFTHQLQPLLPTLPSHNPHILNTRIFNQLPTDQASATAAVQLETARANEHVPRPLPPLPCYSSSSYESASEHNSPYSRPESPQVDASDDYGGEQHQQEQYVAFDNISGGFHHPDTQPPNPLPTSLDEVQAELSSVGDPMVPPKRSRHNQEIAGLYGGYGNGDFAIMTAKKRDIKNKRETPHQKSQGRPFGYAASLVFKYVGDVQQLYKCASHGKDAVGAVIQEQTIHTADLSKYAKNSQSRQTRRSKHGSYDDENDFEVLDIPTWVSETMKDPNDKEPDDSKKRTITVRVYHYTKIGEAIEYYFGNQGITKDNYTYYEVIRASSSLGTLARTLTGNKKVMKIIARPIPDSSIHDIVHIKSNICYPRYKKMMNLFITKGQIAAPYAYYTSDTLWDQEQLMGYDRGDTIYCSPAMLGIDDRMSYQKRLEARKLALEKGVGMDLDINQPQAGGCTQPPSKYSKMQQIEIAQNLKGYCQQVERFQGISVDEFKPGFSGRLDAVLGTTEPVQLGKRPLELPPPSHHHNLRDLASRDTTDREVSAKRRRKSSDVLSVASGTVSPTSSLNSSASTVSTAASSVDEAEANTDQMAVNGLMALGKS